jgi:hypothetical protein
MSMNHNTTGADLLSLRSEQSPAKQLSNEIAVAGKYFANATSAKMKPIKRNLVFEVTMCENQIENGKAGAMSYA